MISKLEIEISQANGSQAGVPDAPETTADIEEGRALIEPEDSGANIGVSLGVSLKEAQESLQHRQEAQTLREISQSVFAQSRSILEEAIRSAEAAGEAYGDGFSADSADNAEAVVMAGGMAEALRTRLRESQAAYQNVLDQALRTNEIATQDLAAALASLNFKVMNAERELEESARASAIADSAKEAAIQELLAVHAMWDGLASHRQRASAQPDAKAAGESVYEPVHRAPAKPMEMPDREASGFSVDNQEKNPDGLTQEEPPVAVPEPVQSSRARPVVFGAGLAKTYGGRVYLMFDPSLTREGLQSVWDAVEEAAGSGFIVDTRLVSQEDGVQVTLDLDETKLDVGTFLRRLPGAQMVPIAKDRLSVAWTAAA
ncbi:MAG: hypothetical protein V3S68_05105 [Dehalococcoidia bacterium]